MKKPSFRTISPSSFRRKPESRFYNVYYRRDRSVTRSSPDLDSGSRPLRGLVQNDVLKTVAVTYALVLLIYSQCLGGFIVDKGETGSAFIKVPVAARAAALGGSFTGASGDITAIEYNPAGLSGIEHLDINLTHLVYLEDTTLESISIGFPFGPMRLSRPTRAAFPVEKDMFVFGSQIRLFRAQDERRNEIGASAGEFDINHRLFHGAVSYTPTDSFSCALGAKLIQNEIESKSMDTYAFDGGLLWKRKERVSLGASLLNVGPSKAYLQEKEPLPTVFRLGGTYRHRQILFLADLSLGRDEIYQPAGGVEWAPFKFFMLRGGLNYHTTIEFSGGFGIQFSEWKNQDSLAPAQSAPQTPADEKSKNLRLGDLRDTPKRVKTTNIGFALDYAFRTQNDLGFTHTVTLKILY
ncbi:MAG: UPF0164 family protein [Elusimicrobia bacterium]|nr:UPF0164 family protein [Candidatus Obscuribacterium magneticum]